MTSEIEFNKRLAQIELLFEQSMKISESIKNRKCNILTSYFGASRWGHASSENTYVIDDKALNLNQAWEYCMNKKRGENNEKSN